MQTQLPVTFESEKINKEHLRAVFSIANVYLRSLNLFFVSHKQKSDSHASELNEKKSFCSEFSTKSTVNNCTTQ